MDKPSWASSVLTHRCEDDDDGDIQTRDIAPLGVPYRPQNVWQEERAFLLHRASTRSNK